MARLLTDRTPDAVAIELHRWAREPFDLAFANCGLSVLVHVERVTGRLMPLWLERIGAKGALRLMADDAAFIDCAARALREMGQLPGGAARRGDVGLIRLPRGLTAAICTAALPVGGMWAARSERGGVIQAAVPEIVWRLSCPRP
jgi:hypothetical protein